MQITDFLNQQDQKSTQPTPQMWFKTALLGALGIYFVYNIITGNLTNYINMRFSWLSYLAAALFLLLAASNTYRLMKPQQSGNRYNRDRTSISWGMMAITAIPLVLGTLVPSRPLGADAISGDFNMNAVASDNVTAFSVNPLDRNVLDWIRAFNASDNLSSFNGQEADVTGFVYRDTTFTEDQFLVARFTVSCCVADAMAIGLPVHWDEAIPQDTWVRVLGRFEVGEFRGEERAILIPTSIDVVEQPEHPYLYP